MSTPYYVPEIEKLNMNLYKLIFTKIIILSRIYIRMSSVTTYKRYRRKTVPKKKKTRVPRMLSGTVGLFGSTSVTRVMKYVSLNTITSVAGAITAQLFTCNGIYDPDYTGAGHQPLWYDQIMPYFQHYCVTKSNIKVNFSYNGTVSTVPLNVGIAVRGTAATSSGAFIYMENANCKSAVLQPALESTRTVNQSFDAKRFFGKKYTVDNYDLKGTITTNPIEDAYYHVYMDPNSGAGTPSIDLCTIIHYTVQFSEPIPVGIS